MKHVPGIVVGGPLTVGGITLLVGLALSQPPDTFNVAAFDRARVLKAANQYLSEAPMTITASTSARSAGGVHDLN